MIAEVHTEHTKYAGSSYFHEAGYDAFLTARVMILLSAKLDAMRNSAQPESRATSPEEQGGVSLSTYPRTSPPKVPDISQADSETSDAMEPEIHQGVAVTVKKKKKKSKKKSKASVPALPSGVAR